MKGFGKDVTMAKVRMAKSNLRREEFRLTSIVNTVLNRTMSACVELIFAEKNIQVKEESIELAEKLLQDNRKSFELGRMNEIDVLQAEARVAEAQEEKLQAETFLIERTNNLKALVFEDYDQIDQIDVKVTDELNTTYDIPAKSDLLQAAWKNNADFKAAEEFVRAQNIAVEMANDGMKPQVDLVGSISYNGLDFDDQVDAVKNYYERDQPSWNLGVTVSYPFGNHAAKAAKRKALLQRRQAEENVGFSKLEIATQLDTALKIVNIASARIASAERSVELARKSLEAEQKRLNLGTTTSYNVAEMQRNLSVAKTRHLASIVEYEKALIKLWAVVGVLKDRMNIDL